MYQYTPLYIHTHTYQDVDWFTKAIGNVLVEELEVMDPPDEPFFVDFMRDPPEPTGDEPDDADLDAPKIYEQVSQTHYIMMGCP